jgi:hypothetical protein
MEKQYIEIKNHKLWGKSLEDVVNLLHKYRDEGQLVKMKFNGITLYSDTVTMDDAYIVATGMTKHEFDMYQESWKKKIKS